MENLSVSCFIIMPFSKTSEKHTETYWTSHYEKFLKETITNVSSVSISRSEAVRGDLIREIIEKLILSDIVVADLTDANPNVYWELGIRQSFKHGTITIAEYGTKLPFDINSNATLWYHPDDHIKNSEFTKRLNSAVKDCISNPTRPDSLVLEIITGRGSLYHLIQEEETNRKLVAILSEYKYNLTVYRKLKKQVTINQENPESKIYNTMLFRTASIELLISHRYVNCELAFYKIAEKYYDHLNSINNRIISWPTRSNNIEKWILRIYNEELFFSIFFEAISKRTPTHNSND